MEQRANSGSQATTSNQEDQVRNYRLMQRARYQAGRLLRPRRRFQNTLESQINPDQELGISQRRRANMVPAEVLYNTFSNSTTHQVYQHYAEERILCTTQQVNLKLMNEQSLRTLQQTGMQHIHLGLCMIRVHALHRRNTGVQVLVVLRDTRWADDRSIIGVMEINLDQGTQLIYLAPNMMLSIQDFYNHMEISIQTRGYDEWQAAESNLLITKGIIARITNTGFAGFQYNIQNVTEYLASHGIRAFEGQPFQAQNLGDRWIIRPPTIARNLLPASVQTNTLMDRTISVRFSGHHDNPLPEEPEMDDLDCEQIHVLLSDTEDIVLPTITDAATREAWGLPPLPSEKAAEGGGEATFIFKSSDSDSDDEAEIIQPLKPLKKRMTARQYRRHLAVPTLPMQHFEDEFQLASDSDQESTISEMLFAGSLEQDLGMDYPLLKELSDGLLKQQTILSTVTSGQSPYRPPTEPLMGQVNYPPAISNMPSYAGTSNPQASLQTRTVKGKGLSSNTWVLPAAQVNSGAMLVLPDDIGMYSDVFARWESITLNHVNEKIWPNVNLKMQYIENLLGETEKKIWMQWRFAYAEEYQQIITIGDETQNILSQIRKVIFLEDPYQGSTIEQNQAYADIERLACDSMKNILSYLNDFKILAAKTGRMFISEELSSKLFRKMPNDIGVEIEKAFLEKYPRSVVSVMPRIHFTYQYLAEMCKKAALQKSLRDLSFCGKMQLPGMKSSSGKKYGLRKSKTYKGKPHDTHVRIFKKKKAQMVRKCKCFICGEEGHFARECTKRNGNIARAAVLENLDIPDDYDVVSVGNNESDSSAICSFSEGEVGAHLHEETIFMLGPEDCGWRYQVFVGDKVKDCNHEWEDFAVLPFDKVNCLTCKTPTSERSRAHCSKCLTTTCPLCSKFYFNKTISLKKDSGAERLRKATLNQTGLVKELMNYAKHLEETLAESTLEESLKKDFDGLKDIPLKKEVFIPEVPAHILTANAYLPTKRTPGSAGYDISSVEDKYIKPRGRELFRTGLSLELWPNTYARVASRSGLSLAHGIEVGAGVIDSDFRGEICVLLYNHSDIEYHVKDGDKIAQLIFEKISNPLIKMTVEPRTVTERGESSFSSGKLSLLLDDRFELEEPAMKEFEDFIYSSNERPIHRLYAMDVTIMNCSKEFKVKAILDTGATVCCINSRFLPKEAIETLSYTVNFNGINSRQSTNTKLKPGTMRIAGQVYPIPFTYCLEMQLKDNIELLLGCNFIKAMGGGVRIEGNDVTFYKKITTITVDNDTEYKTQPAPMIEEAHSLPSVIDTCKPLMEKLKSLGVIGDDPLKFWAKNKVLCKLDIINTDITIQDKPMKNVTIGMEESFKAHIDALLKLKIIRPSQSRHRTMAFIVKSGTTVDPATGKETKGKERMVFNYKSLNDNTFKDQYSLPNMSLIVKKVANSKVFSKFDLKAGFHQVAMHPDSIEWTAFIVPQGLFEWLVMPFGIKNAPAVFQRKMDSTFKGCESFLAIYIDDILVFSRNEQEHAVHLEKMLSICEENGLVLSPTKMKIATPEIDFLGVTIRNRKVKLQEHFIKKVVSFNEDELQSTKGLRSFLGLLNYGRNFIPNLGKLLSPLYSKTSVYGDKKFKEADWVLVRKIKQLVQELPDLELPPPEAFIIIETDGCMEGWGGICKWKPMRFDPKKDEVVCAYASGKFSPLKSSIDAEIHAAMNGLEAFKIHYLDKKEILLRTDCDAIIRFFNKTNTNKPSQVRWLGFIDFCTNTGVKVIFEHISAKDNVLADSLSRLVNLLQEEQWTPSPSTSQLLSLLEEVKDASVVIKGQARAVIAQKCGNNTGTSGSPSRMTSPSTLQCPWSDTRPTAPSSLISKPKPTRIWKPSSMTYSRSSS